MMRHEIYAALMLCAALAAAPAASREVDCHDHYYGIRRAPDDKKSVPDPALSMKTAVTRTRVSELKNDPVGPGDEGEEREVKP